MGVKMIARFRSQSSKPVNKAAALGLLPYTDSPKLDKACLSQDPSMVGVYNQRAVSK